MVDGGGAVGDRGHHECFKTLQCAPWKVQKDSLDLHGSECEFVQSILEEKKKEKNPCPWGGPFDPWCVAALVTSLLRDSSLLRLMNG